MSPQIVRMPLWSVAMLIIFVLYLVLWYSWNFKYWQRHCTLNSVDADDSIKNENKMRKCRQYYLFISCFAGEWENRWLECVCAPTDAGTRFACAHFSLYVDLSLVWCNRTISSNCRIDLIELNICSVPNKSSKQFLMFGWNKFGAQHTRTFAYTIYQWNIID